MRIPVSSTNRRQRATSSRWNAAKAAAGIGAATGFVGAYLSYFLDGATGGVIVLLQAALFALAFLLAPKHGLLAARARRRAA